MKSVDDVITMMYLWRHLLISVTLRWKIKTPVILLKFNKGGKIENENELKLTINNDFS